LCLCILQQDRILRHKTSDIGLPRLNGIEAARQIRKLVPESKIVYLTAETSAEAALRLGAEGYVLKIDVDSDLLVAVEAVMLGKRFVSQHLSEGWSHPLA
jgi:DNA-binding NarL/FixJ family response regulator